MADLRLRRAAASWGFNELSGAFLVAGALAGLVGGLGVMGTLTAYLEGAQSLLPAAMMIGVARSISMVLDDGHVVDTILNALVTALANVPAALSGFLLIPPTRSCTSRCRASAARRC